MHFLLLFPEPREVAVKSVLFSSITKGMKILGKEMVETKFGKLKNRRCVVTESIIQKIKYYAGRGVSPFAL